MLGPSPYSGRLPGGDAGEDAPRAKDGRGGRVKLRFCF